MTLELTTEQLHQELTRRQEEGHQEQQRQAAVTQAAREAWAVHTIAKHEALEKQLEDDGAASMDAAIRAVQDGDLAAAFIGYTEWHASRWARNHLRNATQSAINISPGTTARELPNLRIVDVSFNDWLNEQCATLASKNGVGKFEDAAGPGIPTNYEEATAWMEGNHGA